MGVSQKNLFQKRDSLLDHRNSEMHSIFETQSDNYLHTNKFQPLPKIPQPVVRISKPEPFFQKNLYDRYKVEKCTTHKKCKTNSTSQLFKLDNNVNHSKTEKKPK